MDHDWREIAHSDRIGHHTKLEIHFSSKLAELVISFNAKNCLVIFLLDTILCASFTVILIICPNWYKIKSF